MTAAVNFRELGAGVDAAIRAASLPRTELLVVLDLHGLLCERVSREGAKKRGEREAAFAQRRPAITQRYNQVWLRPRLRDFLNYLVRRHSIAVWSSAALHNVSSLLDDIGDQCGLRDVLQREIRFVWGRDRCKPDFETGGYATMKLLSDLWGHADCGPRFNCTNTLLLDDSFSKVRNFPESAIVVPAYEALTLQEQYNTDDTLLWLAMYLEYRWDDGNTARGQGAESKLDIRASDSCLSLEEFTLAGEIKARQVQLAEADASVDGALAHVFVRETPVPATPAPVSQDATTADASTVPSAESVASTLGARLAAVDLGQEE